METEKRLSVGRLLSELEQRLRSSKESISSQEANILMQLKANALRGFTIGLTGGSVLGWLGCWKLPHLLRLGVTAVTGFGAGIKCFGWSVDSGADYILSLEGTRMQKEFQMMMLNTYRDVPSIMQRSSNHFYSEEVYDDTSDKPRLRWRFRNFYGEVAAADSAGNKEDHDTFVENSNQERTVPKKKINPTMKQTQAVDTEADNSADNPFDCIFGISASQEVPSSEPSNASHRRHRAHKRYHRRHRRRHTDASEV